jgi:small subunit ribosomal protein S8
MNITDPIADMLTRIRNAMMARHSQVAMPTSKMREGIAKILKEEGFIQDYEILPGKFSSLLIHLKYTRDRRSRPVISGLERVSKPGRRTYVGSQEIPRVRSGLGIAILTTPKGLMTGDQARRQGVGGEIICYVW